MTGRPAPGHNPWGALIGLSTVTPAGSAMPHRLRMVPRPTDTALTVADPFTKASKGRPT